MGGLNKLVTTGDSAHPDVTQQSSHQVTFLSTIFNEMEVQIVLIAIEGCYQTLYVTGDLVK